MFKDARDEDRVRDQCEECQGPTEAVLLSDGPEDDFYIKWQCKRGCYICLVCEKIFLYDQTCPHDRRTAKAPKSEKVSAR